MCRAMILRVQAVANVATAAGAGLLLAAVALR